MHPLEIVLSFVEGLALIASPCILPVLPLILSTSISGGRKRPFGIIIGFIIAFTLFALLSRQLVSILHLNLDYIKYGSLIILAMFGIMLFSEKLAHKFSNLTQGLANTGYSLSDKAKDGFLSGILIGILIGLIWTPCAGPILAVALVQIIREQNNLNAVSLILAFAIGAGVPMLIIAITGRKIINRLKFLNNYTAVIRKILAILILLAVAFIASGINIETVFSRASSENTLSTNINQLQNGLFNTYKAPSFALSNIWLNTPNNKPITLYSLKGKVVLVDFWTYSCINCIRTLPYLNDLYEKYRDKGFVIVSIHAPEFEFEKNKDNVIKAIKRYGIKNPVAMDNNLDTWVNFNNKYWPAHYLIDKKGSVVYTHFGEGHYKETENNIRVLLGLSNNSSINESSDSRFSFNQTPETYLGYERSQAFNSHEVIMHDIAKEYSLPDFLASNTWALSGNWLVQSQRIISQGSNTKLQLNFTAKHVYLVLGNQSNMPINITLKLNGRPVRAAAGIDVKNSKMNVQEHRLYELINQRTSANGLLEIDVSKPGLEAYAFTFG